MKGWPWSRFCPLWY